MDDQRLERTVARSGRRGARRAGMRRGMRASIASVIATVAALALSVSPASALVTHELVSTFNGSEAPSGRFFYLLTSSVDNSGGPSAGDVWLGLLKYEKGYVSSIEKFDENGKYAGVHITGAETPQGSVKLLSFKSFQRGQIAVDDSSSANKGDLYVTDIEHGVVDKFNEEGHYICQITGSATASPSECNGAPGSATPAGAMEPAGVAVSASGEVYVSDLAHDVIDEFGANGAYVGQIANAHVTAPAALAIDQAGNLYVDNSPTIGSGVNVVKFSSAGAYLSEVDGSFPHSVAVDPANGHVVVAEGGSKPTIAEYDASGNRLGTTGSKEEFNVSVAGASGRLYAGALFQEEIYGPAVIVPNVAINPASSLEPTAAKLSGQVQPAGGGEVTGCEFEYGTSSSYGSKASCEPATPYAANQAVSASLSGLSKDTIYHYRLSATNANGTNYSEDGSFETTGPPTIEGESATEIEQTRANLSAKIDPHGFATTYQVEYGETSSYGHTQPVPAATAGSGLTAEAVSQTLSGLSLKTGYHYRFIAQSSQGKAEGPDRTFTTAPVASVENQSWGAGPKSAIIKARVDVYGAASSCQLQYVDEAEYKSSEYAHATTIPCTPETLSKVGAEHEMVTLSGLAADAVYHFHFVLENEYGREIGADQTFATFGFESFAAELTGPEGKPFTQAGGHPYEFTTKIDLNSSGDAYGNIPPSGNVKDVRVQLPPGLVGNPTATPRCSRYNSERKQCSGASQVGVMEVVSGAGTFKGVPLFNLVPPKGTAAYFGARFNGFVNAFIEAHVRTGGDYGISADSLNISTLSPITKITVTMWGVPADPSHDAERSCPYPESAKQLGYEPPPCHISAPFKPFLTDPTTCSGPLTANVLADSYQAPGEYVKASYEMSDMTGCEELRFSPSIAVMPESKAADSPSGLQVDLHVPQEESANGLAEADLKNAEVKLPAGVTVNPASASGMVGCPLLSGKEAHPGVPGIDMEDGEAAKCPDASKIGSVELTTPLIEHPLPGAIYLAQQGNAGAAHGSNPFGSLLALYIAIDDPQSGVVVKLAGQVTADPATGQLTTTFDENPQLPFEDLKLSFFGGQRAALATPRTCGSYTTSTVLAPWSGGAAAEPTSVFDITSGPGGSACGPSAFAPGFEAGTASNQAGGFGSFVMNLARKDGEQRLSTVSMTLPPGISGLLSEVALCDEADANAGTCPASTQIGHVLVNAGVGGEPITLPQPGKGEDPVYMTERYDGAPFGLSIVVPAQAGPFDLGTVVVRARIEVDPTTAQVSVISNPMPAMLQGVPLDVKAIHVSIDKPGFMFNPTSCEAMSVAGTIGSQEGANATVASRYQAAGCRGLAFEPSFSALIHAKHSRKDGEYLHVQVRSAFGQANIGRVHVQLPGKLPSRLETLKHACTEQQFATDPAGCPAESIVGHAVAHTPVLPVAMQGPAIFVSHAGKGFPNLDLMLQGDGVSITLVGDTFINKKSITTSTFPSVPDVPIGRFDLVLPAGPHSALAATGNVCSGPLYMPTTLTGQNGAVSKQKTRIMVSGCKAEIRVLSHRAKGKRALVRVSVPSAGRLVASGPGLTRSVVHAGKAQVVRIAAALDRHDRRVLARNRHERVNATLKLSFVPRRNRRDPLDAQVKVLIG